MGLFQYATTGTRILPNGKREQRLGLIPKSFAEFIVLRIAALNVSIVERPHRVPLLECSSQLNADLAKGSAGTARAIVASSSSMRGD